VEKYPCVFVEQADIDKYDALTAEHAAETERLKPVSRWESRFREGCVRIDGLEYRDYVARSKYNKPENGEEVDRNGMWTEVIDREGHCMVMDSPFDLVISGNLERNQISQTLGIDNSGWEQKVEEIRASDDLHKLWLIEMDIKAPNKAMPRISRWESDIAQALRLRKSITQGYLAVATQENDLSLLPNDTPQYVVDSFKLELSTRQASLETAQAKLSELEGQIYAGNPYKDLK
jgi:hypothetical protein